MNKFHQKSFNDFILKNNILSYHENLITLNSGETSNIYVNWRDISNDVFLINKLSDYIIDFADDLKINFDSFYGVREGMSKLGVISQFKRGMLKEDLNVGEYLLPMGRGKEKIHGDKKDGKFLGKPRGNVIILEDVVTTGCSLLKEIWDINDKECQVVSAIVLTDRMKLSDENCFKTELQALRVCYYPLSTLQELEKIII